MKIGIVGLPNAGKSSLFNALTRAGAPAANYPFTTLEPNVAVVGVPDERLDRVAETVGATPIVHEVIQFHDIAGLVRGAHQGEGLGNQFLGNIRETDAILHVVRAHDDAQVVHPEGRVDPLADVETIETELLYADLEQAERRLERVAKQAKSRRQGADRRGALAARGGGRAAGRAGGAHGAAARGRARGRDAAVRAHLEAGPVRGERGRGRSAGAAAGAGGARARRAAPGPRRSARGSRPSWPSSTTTRPRAMRAELGVHESGLATVIREAFELLHLISFFTAGQGKEARARAIERGTRARRAAGRGPHRHGARLRGRRGDLLGGPRARRRLHAGPRAGPARAWRAATTRSATATW